MATIDPNIALGVRPVQIDYPRQESPVNQMAMIMQLQNAQQTNQLNRQKMEEYTRAREMEGVRRNALAGVDLNSPDSFNIVAQRLYNIGDLDGADKMLKARDERDFKRAQTDYEKAKAGKTETEAKVEKTKLFTTRLPIIAQNPTDQAIEQWAKTLVQNDIMSMEQATAGMNQMLALPPEQRSQKLMQSALTAKEALEQHYMQVDSGDKTTIYGMSKYGDGKARVVQETKEGLSPYQKGKLDIERYKASRVDGGGSEAGPGTKLEKGERWNAAEQRIETVPGSKLHVAQSDKHNKDREALKGVETKTQSAITKIDELLSPKYIDGFRANFSGDVPFSGYVTQFVAPDARRRVESLKSDMKAAGLELIRVGGSIGAMTQQEWPIVEQMIAALTPDMTAQEAEIQVKKIRSYMERIENNAKDAYKTEWGDTQYFKPTEKSGARELSSTDKQALDWANSNPKDPRAAQIKQRLGVNK
jgi:hypothetical protein